MVACADHTYSLLWPRSWSLPERFICPKQAVTCLGEVSPFLMVALFSTPVSLLVNRFSFSLQTKFSLLSLSFQPYTVAVSSFQPSSATPAPWLTHFCSEVTGFLADFPRGGLTPQPLPAPVGVAVVLTARVLHTNGFIRWRRCRGTVWGDGQLGSCVRSP